MAGSQNGEEMPVREFTDSWGTEWRVWDVTADVMDPVTRSEEYMHNLRDGWLAFESRTEKRRIPAPYPPDWATYSLSQLEALCQRAAPVIHRTSSPSGAQRAVTTGEMERQAIDQSGEVRTFQSPLGREWAVRIHESFDEAGRAVRVLRFTCGDVIAELTDWPKDWRTATVRDYAVMLLDAEPPRRRPLGHGPQRRRDDRRE
jgi:hypothetical protein